MKYVPELLSAACEMTRKLISCMALLLRRLYPAGITVTVLEPTGIFSEGVGGASETA